MMKNGNGLRDLLWRLAGGVLLLVVAGTGTFALTRASAQDVKEALEKKADKHEVVAIKEDVTEIKETVDDHTKALVKIDKAVSNIVVILEERLPKK